MPPFPLGSDVLAAARGIANPFAILAFGFLLNADFRSPCGPRPAQPAGGARGRLHAWLRHALASPAGPGCSCVPSYEVSRILDFDARVMFSALAATLNARY